MIRSFRGVTPRIGENSYIDESAVVIGDVEMGENCSVWPLTVIRADINKIRIGNNTNIQDGSILHAFKGEKNGDRFGFKVCGLGDINGDGHADVAVTAT